jgi:hypothetical protein
MKRVCLVMMLVLSLAASLDASSVVASADDSTISPLDRLMAQLASAPEMTITGVVGATGVAASKSADNETWHLMVELVAWRAGEGAIRREKLLVRRTIADGEFEMYRDMLPSNRVVTAQIRLLEQSHFPGAQALLLTIPQLVDDDAAMNAVVEALAQPVSRDAAPFGTFTLDRRTNWYEARAKWGRAQIKLALNSENDDDVFPDQAVEHARTLWKSQAEWQRRAEQKMIEVLLELKNDAWLNNGERKLTRAQFLARVRMDTVLMGTDGSFQFCYNDGDLFYAISSTATSSSSKVRSRTESPLQAFRGDGAFGLTSMPLKERLPRENNTTHHARAWCPRLEAGTI